MSKTTEAVRLAVQMANDPKYGYDQAKRWGPDYDCSSFITDVWERVGVKLKSAGASYTGNFRGVAQGLGFRDVTKQVDVSSGAGLQLGDVLLNERAHMAMFIGNGQLVHASINEKGTVTGGQTGDQTGREICTRGYYNFPWDCVLRYGAEAEKSEESKTSPASKTDDLPTLRRGVYKNLSVLAMQAVLITRGFDCGDDGADSDFGENTEKAVMAFQEHYRLEVDGVCGPITWGCLLGVRK